jgi:catechol 2,3-dioxygenase-like lactoylglutathione lyase family enzyme
VSGPRLVTVVLEVADLDRSEKLYREAFGLDLHRSLHDSDDPWIGGAHAAVSWTEGAFVHFALYESRGGARTAGAQVAFAVNDIEEAHSRALAAGAEALHGPRNEPWGRSARYRDPDGNVVELTQRG